MKLFNFNKDVTLVKETKLSDSTLKGMYLGKEDNKYAFSNNSSHVIAYFEKETKPGSNEYNTMLSLHQQHLKNLFNVYSNAQNKASFIYFNPSLSINEFRACLNETYEENIKELTNKPSYAYLTDASVLHSVLSELFIKRKDAVQKNNIFVVIDNFENVNIKEIETFLTISRSRNIFFVLLVTDMKKSIKNVGAETFNIIDGNILTHFVYFATGEKRVTINKGSSNKKIIVYKN